MSLTCNDIKEGFVMMHLGPEQQTGPMSIDAKVVVYDDHKRDIYLLIPVDSEGKNYFAGVTIGRNCAIRLFDDHREPLTSNISESTPANFNGGDNLSFYLSILKHGIENYLYDKFMLTYCYSNFPFGGAVQVK